MARWRGPVIADGGVLTIEEEFTVSNFTNNGATVYPNNTKSGGNAITNAYLKGGTTDATQSSQPRTWANVYLDRDGVLVADEDVLTVTNWHEPEGGTAERVVMN